jgi:hypothetical protein
VFERSKPLRSLIVCTLVGGLWVVGCVLRTEDEIQAEFEAFVEARNTCQADGDCDRAAASCPLGCQAFVRKEFVRETEKKAKELIDEYEGDGPGCDYRCGVAGDPVCRAGRCNGANL